MFACVLLQSTLASHCKGSAQALWQGTSPQFIRRLVSGILGELDHLTPDSRVHNVLPKIISQILEDSHNVSHKEETASFIHRLGTASAEGALGVDQKRMVSGLVQVAWGPLIELFQEGAQSTRPAALAGLHVLSVAVPTEKMAQVLEPVVLHRAVRFLSAKPSSGSIHAAGLLANLAKDPETHSRILAAGAVQPLIKIMGETVKDGSSSDAQELAAQAIMNLSAGDAGTKKRVVKEGFLQAAVHVLKKGSPHAIKDVERSLWNLSLNEIVRLFLGAEATRLGIFFEIEQFLLQ